MELFDDDYIYFIDRFDYINLCQNFWKLDDFTYTHPKYRQKVLSK